MEGILHSKEISEIIPFSYQEPVLLFPVRHHSPACCFHLLKVIEEYNPDCILVEGPENAEKLIPVLTDDHTILPVAFYYFYKDKGKYISEDGSDHKCYYPFLNTSPEYQALREAAKRGIRSGMIDLPYGEILINTAENKGIREKHEVQVYNDDYYFSRNNYHQVLCQKTGMRSFEEFWEKYFEIDGIYISTEEFIRRMLTYCCMIRRNTPSEEMTEDGTIVRESFMAEKILDAAKVYKRVLVVTGGFHTPALYKRISGNSPKKDKKVRLHHFSEDIQNVYAMKYSYEAADALNGYAAGIQSPGFYNRVWEKLVQSLQDHTSPSGAYKNSVMETIIAAAKDCSAAGILITMPDIAESVSMTGGLAALREKKEPGLYEMFDGVRSCFVKGELNTAGELPLKLLQKTATGKKTGQLCDSAEKIPIIQDFEQLCKKYRLKTDEVIEQKIELDLFAKPLHLEISRFFYRLRFLGADFAKKIKGADLIHNKDRSRIREIWHYKRTAETDAALIDVSVAGGTVADACMMTASEKLRNENKCSEAARLYVDCFLMDTDLTDSFAQRMGDIIINDGDFFSLGKAVYYFNMLNTLRKLYKNDKIDAYYFLSVCFRKLAGLLPDMIKVQPEYADEVIRICKMLYNLVCKPEMHEEKELLLSAFSTMTAKNNPEPSVYGAVLGLLYCNADAQKSEISRAFEGYMTGTEEMKKQGASFLRGLFMTARDIVLIGSEFTEMTDKLLHSLSMGEFIDVLPELRLAFSFFTPSEIDTIAAKVASLYGSSSTDMQKFTQFNEQLYLAGKELDQMICRLNHNDSGGDLV